MCRYAQYSYKRHLACFDCRKTFKRRWLTDINRDMFDADSVAATCPQCHGMMADMGLDFKSPPMADVRAWQHLRTLYSVGITYHSCGCSGPGYVPATTAGVADYLAQRLDGYVQEQRYWLSRPELTTRAEREADKRDNWIHNSGVPSTAKNGKGYPDVAQALAYWQQRVNDLESDLNRVKAQLPVK